MLHCTEALSTMNKNVTGGIKEDNKTLGVGTNKFSAYC
jgi:hypothetical protein